MAVGAGSIKRASKLNAAAEEVVKKEEVKKDVVLVEKKTTTKATGEKAVTKKSTTKTTAEKAATPKKTTAKKALVKVEEPTEVKKAVVEPPKAGNVACHLTEDLPVYLL